MSNDARRGLSVLLSHFDTFGRGAIHGKKLADDLRAAGVDAYAATQELLEPMIIEGREDKHQCATVYRYDPEKVRRLYSGKVRPDPPKLSVNERMIGKMASDLETVKGWTAQKWPFFLGVANQP